MDFLLISASFFGYAKEIKSALELRGRSVLWFEDRPSLDTKTKVFLRIMPSLVRAKSEAYFENIIKEASKHPIRDVLVIKGEALSPKMIKKMRESLPKARFTIYFWDSYHNMPADSSQKVDLFDRAFSFDPVDVKQDHRLTFQPLFYLDEYAKLRNSTEHQDIDVLFIGTAHSDRYAVLKRIASQLPSGLRFERVLYMRSHILYRLLSIFNPDYWFSSKKDFIFNPMSKNEIMTLISRSRIIIDIERTIQSGYTMRTVEMLGASRKLITTNKQIENSDFYTPNNFLVIDRKNPKIPKSFLNKKLETPNEETLKKYSLSGWLDSITN